MAIRQLERSFDRSGSLSLAADGNIRTNDQAGPQPSETNAPGIEQHFEFGCDRNWNTFDIYISRAPAVLDRAWDFPAQGDALGPIEIAITNTSAYRWALDDLHVYQPTTDRLFAVGFD